MPRTSPMPSINEPLLSDSDVATLLGVSRTTVRRLRYSGALPTTRVGSLARVPRSAVAAYVAQQTKG